MHSHEFLKMLPRWFMSHLPYIIYVNEEHLTQAKHSGDSYHTLQVCNSHPGLAICIISRDKGHEFRQEMRLRGDLL